MTEPQGPPAHLRAVAAVRYVTPLREGGSLPAIIEADDGRLYVAKFRGAGQGIRALIAEVIAGELGRALGLPVPELVLIDFGAALARAEPDAEIRALLQASVGVNLGLAYVAGALTFDVAARPAVPAALASLVVVLDAFTMNVDRTARNPNLLVAGGDLWLIDHGAALYWHHDWDGSTTGSDRPFSLVRDHVLLPFAEALPAAGDALAAGLDDATLDRALALIPDAWFPATPALPTAAAHRTAYAAFLRARREARGTFLEEAIRARAARV
jgi:hypothetical protein